MKGIGRMYETVREWEIEQSIERSSKSINIFISICNKISVSGINGQYKLNNQI